MHQESNRPSDKSSEPEKKAVQRFSDLLHVLYRLLGPDGCPWDRQQTPKTLKKFILEEAYEVVDAIDHEDQAEIKEELGDLFFQTLFLAQLHAQSGEFQISDVFSGAYEKMVRRHPHVFGEVNHATVEDIRSTWSKLRQEEKTHGEHLFDDRDTALPALLHSHKIGSRAATVGFDWDGPEAVFEKVREEIDEVRRADHAGDREQLAEELGDVLFVVSNWIRHYGFEPEETLRAANRKFISRFSQMEKLAKDRGLIFNDLSMQEKDRLWEETKKRE